MINETSISPIYTLSDPSLLSASGWEYHNRKQPKVAIWGLGKAPAVAKYTTLTLEAKRICGIPKGNLLTR